MLEPLLTRWVQVQVQGWVRLERAVHWTRLRAQRRAQRTLTPHWVQWVQWVQWMQWVQRVLHLLVSQWVLRSLLVLRGGRRVPQAGLQMETGRRGRPGAQGQGQRQWRGPWPGLGQ